MATEEEGGGRGGRGGRGGARPEVASPDGTRVAFIRNYNLWVREVSSGKETALTTDGVKDFGYATDNAGWSKSERPIVLWSPDSKKIATFQHDGRKVGEMYLVDTRVGHPQLQAWKYPLPGDEHIFMIERVVIDVPTAKVVRFKMDPDPHRSTLCDHVACRGDWGDVQWHPDGSKLAFVSSSRDHKQATLRVADTVDRRCADGIDREGRHVLRVRQRARELALSARVERGDLVLRARQLGTALSVRPAERRA